MAQVYPFRAFRYKPAHAKFEDVLTQPYDKISPAMQDKYYSAHPHNLIAVEKGRVHANDAPGNNVYTRAAAAIDEWIRAGTVVQDPTDAFYGYTQEYTVPGTGEKLTRRGFIGAGKLEEYSAGVVYRHEHTLSGPKADRLELLRHTRMHTGQLFMIYSDAQKRVDKVLEQAEAAMGTPTAQMLDEYGVVHRLWVIADAEQVNAIREAMTDQKLVIADGHHRYETALNYRNERRTQAGSVLPDAAYERAMMTFINTQGTVLTILPTHRVVANLREFNWPELRRYLEPWFTAESIAVKDEGAKDSAGEEFLRRLTAARGQRAIGVYPASEKQNRAFYVLTLRDGVDLKRLLPNVSPLQRELDVVLLHEGILEPGLGITPQSVKAEANLTYEREAAAAIAAVDSGAAQIAFFLNACDVEQVVKVATAGEVMPQKSTDFYPKLMSGITMYSVDGERG